MTERVGLEEDVGIHMIQRPEPQMRQKSMKPKISNVILAVPFRKLEMKHKQEAHPTRVTTENHKRCYVCDLEVNDIMELMSHRKEHHPPNKKCRNLGTCRFGERCWYAHEETETDEEKEPRPVSFECNVCGDVSRTRDEMKQHRKRNHPTKVEICKRFKAGTCRWSDDTCW